MSANNWMKCPSCVAKADARRQRKIELARSKYGKVSESEYRDLMKKAERHVEIEETFREDYEIGMSVSGNYSHSYYGFCTRCGFEFEHKHSHRVLK